MILGLGGFGVTVNQLGTHAFKWFDDRWGFMRLLVHDSTEGTTGQTHAPSPILIRCTGQRRPSTAGVFFPRCGASDCSRGDPSSHGATTGGAPQ